MNILLNAIDFSLISCTQQEASKCKENFEKKGNDNQMSVWFMLNAMGNSSLSLFFLMKDILHASELNFVVVNPTKSETGNSPINF